MNLRRTVLLTVILAAAYHQELRASAGQRCMTAPESIGALPLPINGNTATSPGDDFDIGAGSVCRNGFVFATPAGVGKDEVRRFRFDRSCPVTIQLNPSPTSYDLVAYVITNCAQVDASCVAGVDGAAAGSSETLNFTAVAGQEYFLIVDGFSGDQGTFTGSVVSNTACSAINDGIFFSGFDFP